MLCPDTNRKTNEMSFHHFFLKYFYVFNFELKKNIYLKILLSKKVFKKVDQKNESKRPPK